MAEIPDGINGPVIGKVGTVVGYMYRGKAIIRALPKKRGSKRTIEEKVNTTGFARLQKWMKPIGEFVRYGFKDYGTVSGGYKSAISYALLNKAIQGKYPKQFVDPQIIRVTGGELLIPATSGYVLEEGNIIRFNWDKGDSEGINTTDQAMLLAYSPATSKSAETNVQSKTTGAFRTDGTDTLQVEAQRYDQEFYLYLGFVNAHRTQQSHSQYLGSIVIKAMEQDQLFETRTASRKARADKKDKPKLTIQDKTLDIARNLRNMGLTDADIAIATGLSLEAISKIEIS